jgi:aerobic carbon-monoxide dehydrogenase large subunit
MTTFEPRYIGARTRRIEDPALLRGAGRFVDDVRLPGMLHAAFVRSPHAHALIRGIDTTACMSVPGVVTVLTAADLSTVLRSPRMPLGFPTKTLPPNITPFVLTPTEVCFVGEAVAMVIADSRYAAEDGVSAIAVDYEVLPALSDCRDVLRTNAPKVRREATDNILTRFAIAYGACETVFAEAAHVIAESYWQHRGGAHPLEGRGVVAQFEPAAQSLTVWSSTQMSHELMFTLAEVLDMPESSVRVIAPDVGGGFGAKFLLYPEELAIPAAAQLLGRPIKWIEDRAEHFIASIQERDQYWDMEIALDRDAHILGVRGRLIHDQGAYTPQGINCPYNAATSVTGPYVVPHYDLDVIVAQTNKVYTIPVRGAGYPEAAFVMERLLDRAAGELGIDRAEIRLRNLVPTEKLPYEKPLKTRAGKAIILDSGDYAACQREVLAAIDYAGFRARQNAARRDGRYLGIGFAHAVKGTGRGPFESGVVKVTPTGRISVATGALAMGQGVKTALAQVCAELLGVRPDQVDVIAGDTAHVSLGVGGFASRQMVVAGSAVYLASREVRRRAVKVAAHMLEAAEEDLILIDGKVQVNGVPDMFVALADIARALRGVPGYNLPTDVEAGLEASVNWQPEAMAYANAFHACEVEVDIGTGDTRILRYIGLQDSGRLVNPLIAEGQIAGGIAHGIGNSLFEFMRYDEHAQPVSMTFADYLLPTSMAVPTLDVRFKESPSPFNPLGVKGVGEGGTIPVAAAVASAVEDALAPFGVRIVDVPINPARLVAMVRRGQPARNV